MHCFVLCVYFIAAGGVTMRFHRESGDACLGRQGYILNSTIDGCIQMKSYLSGNPGLRLALNEDLVVGKGSSTGAYGAVVLDDCNFHECVNLDDFEATRTLALIPPDGANARRVHPVMFPAMAWAVERLFYEVLDGCVYSLVRRRVCGDELPCDGRVPGSVPVVPLPRGVHAVQSRACPEGPLCWQGSV